MPAMAAPKTALRRVENASAVAATLLPAVNASLKGAMDRRLLLPPL